MIVRIHADGKSFSGAATYLTHDPNAKTADRVGWTHTLNLAHDHVLSAVDEMLWTARNAELLKQEAGVRAGGCVTENPVKHISLNWSPEDRPTRDHMLETTEDFLRAMKWDEHQAVIVAHEDKEHAHVHVLLNAIHPETGLRLNDDFEQRRASAWALGYEREQGNIRCENRLEDICDREDGPTRPAWMAFKGVQKTFEENEKSLSAQEINFSGEPENPENRPKKEWKKLKEIQRDERLAFFAAGKSEFKELRNSIYREVREEFREQWADYFAAAKNGDPEALKEMKAALVEAQTKLLEERRDIACRELRETRNEHYRDLLDDQREIRLGLHARQHAKLDSLEFIDLFKVERPIIVDNRTLSPREADRQTAIHREERGGMEPAPEAVSSYRPEPRNGMRSGSAVASSVATGFADIFLNFFSAITDGEGSQQPAPERVEPDPKRDPFYVAAEEARIKSQRDREDEESRRRSEESDRSRQ